MKIKTKMILVLNGEQIGEIHPDTILLKEFYEKPIHSFIRQHSEYLMDYLKGNINGEVVPA